MSTGNGGFFWMDGFRIKQPKRRPSHAGGGERVCVLPPPFRVSGMGVRGGGEEPMVEVLVFF